jgi:hypothetical protein
VRRFAIQQWLEYLQEHHPTFRSNQVTVDYNLLDQLPENGLVHNRLRMMENQDIEDAFRDVGPPQGLNPEDGQQADPLYSAGFVPNMQN